MITILRKERMNTVYNLVTWFQLNYPHHVEAMKNTSHHFSKNDLNVWHGEGDIWTHTMMALNVAKMMGYNETVQYSILLHDLGKPYVIERNEEKKRVYFKQHEGVSFWFAIEVIKNLTNNVEQIKDVLKLISLHSIIFNHNNGKKFSKDFIFKFRNDIEFLELLKQLVISDSMGRFCIDLADDRDITKNIFNEDFYEELNEETEKFNNLSFEGKNNLTVLIGLPRSGKTTWVENNVKDEIVISRDNEVMNFAKENCNTYSECFRLLTEEDQKQIDKNIDNQFRDAIKKHKDIVIDMTNLSKKSRRRWVNNFDGYKKAIVFATDYQEILRRNKHDKEFIGKYIPEKTIFKMAKNFIYPQYDEFNEIIMIL